MIVIPDIKSSANSGSVIVAGCSDGAVFASSDDGATWSGSSPLGANAIGAAVWSAALALFIIGSANGHIATSPDGLAWTDRGAVFASPAAAVGALAAGPALLVAVDATGRIKTSPTGTTWTARTSPTTNALRAAIYGNGLFVVAGALGTLATSTDGVAWTLRSTLFGSASINGLAYGRGLFVAAGDAGNLETSADGSTWSPQISAFDTSAIYAVGYASGSFVAAGAGGLTASSPDGLLWDLIDNDFGVADLFTVSSGVPVYEPTQVIHPTLLTYSLAPTVIDPGKGLGMRASMTLRLADEPWADLDTDPYVATRSYKPADQGTYWGKLLARSPFYQNRLLIVYTGYLAPGAAGSVAVFDPSLCKASTYVLDQIAGPAADRTVTITAKDVLKLADDKRAQAPLPNTAVLLADISPTDMALTLSPAGIGDEEYPASGTIAITNECITFTRVGDVLTFVSRGTDGTSAQDHSAGDTPQLCLRYTGARVDAVIFDLLVNYGNVSAEFIDRAAWATEALTWLSSTLLTTLIAKPEGVTTLLQELCEQCLLSIWWDERQARIIFRALQPARGAVVALTDAKHLLADTVSVTESPDERISEIYIYYGQVNPLLDLERTDNYTRASIPADLLAESSIEYGEQRIKTIFSRWFKPLNISQVTALGTRLLAKYRDNPKTIAFALDAKDGGLWTGDLATLTSSQLQDIYGGSPALGIEIISAREDVGGHRLAYEAIDTAFTKRYGYVSPDDTPVYSLATADQQGRYGFICTDEAVMNNGDSGYFII